MGIEILEDRDMNHKIMFCNTTDWAFGPVFNYDDDVENFMDFAEREMKVSDVRQLTDPQMEAVYGKWRVIREDIEQAQKDGYPKDFLKQLHGIEVEDIDPSDAPDYSDAFISRAYFRSVELSDDELYEINDKCRDWCYTIIDAEAREYY